MSHVAYELSHVTPRGAWRLLECQVSVSLSHIKWLILHEMSHEPYELSHVTLRRAWRRRKWQGSSLSPCHVWNKSCHLEWVMTHINGSCLPCAYIWNNSYSTKYVVSRMNWVMSHCENNDDGWNTGCLSACHIWNETCHMEWVMTHLHESCRPLSFIWNEAMYRYILIKRTPPPRGGFLFSRFPDQEPGGRGPPLKKHP